MSDEPTCRCGHPLDDHSQLSGACWPPGSGSDKTKRCDCNRFEVPT